MAECSFTNERIVELSPDRKHWFATRGFQLETFNLVGNYMFKVDNRNTGTRCEICSKLTMRHSGFFTVNFEHISHLFLVFLLLTLSR